jgi:hypothetical protein
LVCEVGLRYAEITPYAGDELAKSDTIAHLFR